MKSYVVVTDSINNKGGSKAEKLDWNDMYNSFKVNIQLNSAYQISFTVTRTNQYKDAFNMLQLGHGIWFQGQEYFIKQRELGLDENGCLTAQITATAILIDFMKNIRLDPKQPTEDDPDVSGGDSSSDSSSDDSQQIGTVVKPTDQQQTYSLQNRLDQFFNNNDQGISYELHGNFPQIVVDCSGSLYEWLGNNLALFGAYYVPDNFVLKIYDLQSLQHSSGKEYRYLHNVTSLDIQQDTSSMYNDFDVFGGKMEKDITTGASGVGNGVSEAVNGDWTPVIKNAAGLVGENLSQADINLVLAQINLESSGRENAQGGTDGLSDGPALGLLQFKQDTFNYYCRPPYTNIMHGLDQIIALFNVPGWRNQITGQHGWSPQGAPVSKAPIQAQASAGNAANQIVDYCRSFVGKVPYVWGGSSPSGWDCSGMVCYILNHFGISTPRTNTIGLESKGSVVGPPYQTGDLLFWGPRGASYHVSIAMDSTWRVGADNYQDGTVYRTIASWPPQFAVRIPQFAALAGGTATNTGDSSSLTTITQTYYALYYHYRDEDSYNRIGLFKGPQVIVDSIYDMDALKSYVDRTVAHQPPTSLTNNEVGYDNFTIGETGRVIAKEVNIDEQMTLMGIEYNPFNPDADVTLTWNNTALAMKDVIYALYNSITETNRNVANNDSFGTLGATAEDHFKNIDADRAAASSGGQAQRSPVFDSSQVEAINKFVNS